MLRVGVKEEAGESKGEGERERELAKAALSVAELGEAVHLTGSPSDGDRFAIKATFI